MQRAALGTERRAREIAVQAPRGELMNVQVAGAQRVSEDAYRRRHDVKPTNWLGRVDQQHSPARLEHAIDLSESAADVLYVLNNMEGVDLVEARVRERELRGVHYPQPADYRVRYGLAIDIDADRGRGELAHAPRKKATATADVENSIRGPGLKKLVYAPKVTLDFDPTVQERVLPRLVVQAHGRLLVGVSSQRGEARPIGSSVGDVS